MCSMCLKNPCVSACPNSDYYMTDTIGYCNICDKVIVENLEHGEINNKLYCVECLEDLTAYSFLKIIGGIEK